jgi:hypothetical protein
MKTWPLDRDRFLFVTEVKLRQVILNHQSNEFFELSDVNHGLWSAAAPSARE